MILNCSIFRVSNFEFRFSSFEPRRRAPRLAVVSVYFLRNGIANSRGFFWQFSERQWPAPRHRDGQLTTDNGHCSSDSRLLGPDSYFLSSFFFRRRKRGEERYYAHELKLK